MKIRNGFVSNSSSSSFVLQVKKEKDSGYCFKLSDKLSKVIVDDINKEYEIEPLKYNTDEYDYWLTMLDPDGCIRDDLEEIEGTIFGFKKEDVAGCCGYIDGSPMGTPYNWEAPGYNGYFKEIIKGKYKFYIAQEQIDRSKGILNSASKETI